MSFRVVILESAEHDLKELRSYVVRNHSHDAWVNTYGRIKETVRNLVNFPLAGSIPAELEKLGLLQYRQALSGLNRIIYEVRRDIIYIHVIADTRRDMKSILMRRLLRVN